MSDGLPLFKKPWFEWFAWYSKGYLAKHFRALRLLKTGRPVVDSAEPLIVYMNHASWWDPIVGLLIAKELWPSRTHYGAMDREALQSYKFFEKVGFFGVERGSPRGAAQFLKTAKVITGTPATALWMTPQGRFADARERPPELMSGLPQVLTKLEAGTVQPIAIEYTFWDERLPEVLVSLGPTCRVTDLPRDREACQRRLSELLVQAQDELQAAAMHRDSALFDSLIEGRQGMSNVYGLWRSFKRGWSGR